MKCWCTTVCGHDDGKNSVLVSYRLEEGHACRKAGPGETEPFINCLSCKR